MPNTKEEVEGRVMLFLLLRGSKNVFRRRTVAVNVSGLDEVVGHGQVSKHGVVHRMARARVVGLPKKIFKLSKLVHGSRSNRITLLNI